MMPEEKFFIDAMKRLDVKCTDHVICYDTGAMQFFGYRAAWMFQAMNHKNVQVLDGGFPKWIGEGKPIEATDAHATVDDFCYSLQSDKIKMLVTMQQYDKEPAERSFQLIDARGPAQFDAGNIGGSVNIPFGELVDGESKTLKSQDERRAVYQAAGIDLQKDIVVSCTGGITASVLYGSLKDITTGKLALYDGSWAEFSKNK